jgi:hypothetical protein
LKAANVNSRRSVGIHLSSLSTRNHKEQPRGEGRRGDDMPDRPDLPEGGRERPGPEPGDVRRPIGGQNKRRGRPLGSVSLTPEIRERLLELIRGGTYDYIAAEAVGISARTFREWIQRGEGEHPTRPASRKLKALAKDVRRAKAEARAAAEIRVFRDNASRWLSYQGRTKPGREGWTHPPETQADQGSARLEELIRELEDDGPARAPSSEGPAPQRLDASPEDQGEPT